MELATFLWPAFSGVSAVLFWAGVCWKWDHVVHAWGHAPVRVKGVARACVYARMRTLVRYTIRVFFLLWWYVRGHHAF